MSPFCTHHSSSTAAALPSVALPPQALPAPSFERPESSQGAPTTRYRKNVKSITGFGTTEEEFAALPVTLRRKYFSNQERLCFTLPSAQSQSNPSNDQPVQTQPKSSLADRRRLNIASIEPRRQGSTSKRLRRLSRHLSLSSNEVSWFLTLPKKITKKQFAAEEAVLAEGHRQNGILDAVDEAIYLPRNCASRNPNHLTTHRAPASARNSTESSRTGHEQSAMAATIYESFRWMDEEADLDLKLVLDDYHANLDGAVLPSSQSHTRPSFRRTMSVSKMPFGRNSISSLQPRSPKFESNTTNTHGRQRSRALSLIGPRHLTIDSVSSIDPNATHYQDPEARLKLRVYLASPQKFDEAIEFGFPSADKATFDFDKENQPPNLLPNDFMKNILVTEKEKSFLVDDMTSLFDDDSSMFDPESPLTPKGLDSGYRRQNPLPSNAPRSAKTSVECSNVPLPRSPVVKQPDSYAQTVAGCREMTLRMTLTRPDLRADETTIYGWQTPKGRLRSGSLRAGSMALEDPEERYEIRGPFGGVDGWGSLEKEDGVVKRFWNKVKSSQRRTS